METNKQLRYLIDKKELIENLKVFPRNIKIKSTKNFITSLIGPRRAGKSYFVYDLIKNKLNLKDKDYMFIDFEDPELVDITYKDIISFVDLHEQHHGTKPKYIFLDEVQVLNNWEKSIRKLFETKNYHLFVTGSSSKLLSKEIATSLRGRSLTYKVFPLSFKEYLSFNKFKFKKTYSSSEINKLKNKLRNYLEYGAFPDVVIEKDIMSQFFKEYVELVVFKDLIERHNIKNVYAARFLIKELLSSFSKKFSINKTFNSLKSQNIEISKKTLYNYSEYFKDAFFSFFLKKYSFSQKKSELSLHKVYINDTGLINSNLIKFSDNIGKLMENVVFLELQRKEEDIYYWETQSYEIDFLIKENNQVKQLIQVCHNLKKDDTKEREIKSLIKASQELRCNNLLVITFDYEESEEVNNKVIHYIPLWKYLLN